MPGFMELPDRAKVVSTRRHFLRGGLLAAATMTSNTDAHNATGFVKPPAVPPATPVTLHTGKSDTLANLCKGRVTALQLMFTGCSATCPIQGALFATALAKLQALKPALPQAQLISLSIDPLADGPQALSDWLKRFGSGQQWLAAAPSMKALDPFLDFLQGRSTNVDRHTGQVYFFDPQGRLVLRTVDFPPGETVVSLLKNLAALH
jgi:protein SCO1/2